MEFFLDFWGKFKDYFGEIQVINDPEKWKVLQELDSREPREDKVLCYKVYLYLLIRKSEMNQSKNITTHLHIGGINLEFTLSVSLTIFSVSFHPFLSLSMQ